jgi:hypothetical protein
MKDEAKKQRDEEFLGYVTKCVNQWKSMGAVNDN